MTASAAPIQVEVLEAPGTGTRPGALDKLGAGVEYTGGGLAVAASHVVEGIDAADIRRGIESICHAVTLALEKAAPDNWTVELNLGFKAGLKVPVLMSGEANAALKLTMNWKKTA